MRRPDDLNFAGSSTEWFLGYAVVGFILVVVCVSASDYVLAGVFLAGTALAAIGAWRSWKST